MSARDLPGDGADSSKAWPHVARAGELRAVLAALDERPARLHVLDGPAGAGKSALAHAIVRARGEAAPLVAMASWERANIPFGVLASMLDDTHGDAGEAAVAAVATALGAALGDRSLVVDDASRLDSLSAEVVRRLVRGLGRTVIATARRGEPLPDALRDLAAEDLVRRHVLEGLSAEETAQLLEARFRVPARAESVSWLVWQTDGNPLHLRMLVEDAIEAGDVLHRGDTVELRAPSQLAPLAAAIARRLDALSPDARELLAVITLTQPTRRESVLTLPSRERALDELFRRGMVVSDGSQALRPSHPLLGESPSLSVVLERALHEAVRILRGGGDPAGRFEAVDLELRAGLEPPVDELMWGAGYAGARGDHRGAARFADAAVDRPAPRGVAFTAHLTAATQHSLAGDLDDADRLFAAAEMLARDSSELALLAGAWGDHLAHRHGDPAHAIAHGERVRSGLTDETAVALDADLWRWRASAARAAGDQRVDVAGAISATVAAAMRGEYQAARAAVAPLTASGVDLGDLAATAAIALGLQRFVELRSTKPADEAARFLEATRAAAGDEVGFVTLLLAAHRMQGGRLDEAHDLAELAIEQLARWDGGELGSLAIAVRATVDARRGDVTAARSWLAELEGREVSGAAVLQRAECRAFVAAAEGDLAGAADHILEVVAEAAGSGYRFLGALTLAEAIRFGEFDRTAALAEEICRGMAEPGGPAEAVRDLAVALRDRDAERVPAAASRLAQHGLAPVAADSVTLALGMSTSADVRRRLQSLATELATGIEDALLHERPSAGLTARELEVARAAAGRLRGREIAELLGISPRTVENQLYSVYRKLEVSSRADLRTALRDAGLLADDAVAGA